jgi:hypothetical protein
VCNAAVFWHADHVLPHRVDANNGDSILTIQLGLAPIVSLLAGILILVMPRMLNYIVAIYLIVIGLIGLFGAGQLRLN